MALLLFSQQCQLQFLNPLVLFVAAYALCRFKIKVVVSGVLNAAAQQFKIPLPNRWWEVFEASGVTFKPSAKFLQPFLNRQRLNTLNLDLQIIYFGYKA